VCVCVWTRLLLCVNSCSLSLPYVCCFCGSEGVSDLSDATASFSSDEGSSVCSAVDRTVVHPSESGNYFPDFSFTNLGELSQLNQLLVSGERDILFPNLDCTHSGESTPVASSSRLVFFFFFFFARVRVGRELTGILP
jgi:hypothetical protein